MHKEGNFWREKEGSKERDPHNFEGEASMDHPIGEGLGWMNFPKGWMNFCELQHSMTFEVILI